MKKNGHVNFYENSKHIKSYDIPLAAVPSSLIFSFLS
jgi:hypothetical protein